MANFEQSSSATLAIKTDQPECFRCETHAAGLLKRLHVRQDLCDVVLIVGESGKRISAHRLILMASSDFFSDLLSEPKDESKVWEVPLNNVDGDALEELVSFCYTGSLELRVDTIKNMVITANYLQLKEITEGCCEFFLRHQQPSNYLDVAFFAEKLNLEALLHNVKKVICTHFEEVSEHPEFLLLNAKQLSELIASDDLDAPSEEFVFQVIMKWIEFEPENRRKHFTELLAQVRLPLLSTTFLMKKVEPLCNTMENQILVLKELKSRLLPTSNFTQPTNPSLKRVVNQPRNSSSKSVVNQLWAICAKKSTEPIENLAIVGYNLRTNVWNIWDTPIKHRSEFAAILMGEDLILVGGLSNNSPINTVTKLNVHTMVSSEMTPLRTSRSHHAVAVLNGSIYAIGGHNGRQDLNSVERYDPVNRTWDFIPLMKNPRRRSAVAVINDCLYVSGGEGGGYVVSSVECYDPVENTWRSTAPMESVRYSHCLAVHKGYLFAIGGSDAPGVERYDPRTDTWTTISCLPNITSDTRCASIGSEVFIFEMENSEFYRISRHLINSEGSFDILELQILHKPSDTFISFYCRELIGIPFDASPPRNWIRKKEF